MMLKLLKNIFSSLAIIAVCAFLTVNGVKFFNNFEWISDQELAVLEDVQKKNGQTVIMFATTWCRYCEQARHFFEKNGIEYLELDIEESGEALQQFKSLGGLGTPLILVDKSIIRGFNEPRLKSFFELD